MTLLEFTINYKTEYEEDLYIIINDKQIIPMKWTEYHNWKYECKIFQKTIFEWKYLIKRKDYIILIENCENRKYTFELKNYKITDFWNYPLSSQFETIEIENIEEIIEKKYPNIKQIKQYENKKGKIDLYSLFISSQYFETINDFINIELASPKFYRNMEKYYYNPISLNHKTKHFFPNIQTYWKYFFGDPEFSNDFTIKQRKESKTINWKLKCEEIEKLEEWTGKKIKGIYPSGCNSSCFNDTTELNKSILLIETDDNIRFGIFIPRKINNIEYDWYNKYTGEASTSVYNSFLFTFKDDKSMKFESKEEGLMGKTTVDILTTYFWVE